MNSPEAVFFPQGLFSRTRWSLVRRASQQDQAGRDALAELLAIYWYPLYAWARRRGLSPEDASDGVQSFVEGGFERGHILGHI